MRTYNSFLRRLMYQRKKSRQKVPKAVPPTTSNGFFTDVNIAGYGMVDDERLDEEGEFPALIQSADGTTTQRVFLEYISQVVKQKVHELSSLPQSAPEDSIIDDININWIVATDVEDEHEQGEEMETEELIFNWMMSANVSDNQMTNLLRILKAAGMDVPCDIRSSYQKFIQTENFKVQEKDFVYLGIEYNLNAMLTRFPKLFSRCYFGKKRLVLNFNTDGVSLSRSGKQQIWPICMSTSVKPEYVSVVAFYWGKKHPESSALLADFVAELDKILDRGFKFTIKNADDPSQTRIVALELQVGHFVADIPAMATVKEVMGAGGYFACTKCDIQGEHSTERRSRFYLPSRQEMMRTDDELRLGEKHPLHSVAKHHRKGHTSISLRATHICENQSSRYVHHRWNAYSVSGCREETIYLLARKIQHS